MGPMRGVSPGWKKLCFILHHMQSVQILKVSSLSGSPRTKQGGTSSSETTSTPSPSGCSGQEAHPLHQALSQVSRGKNKCWSTLPAGSTLIRALR